MVQIGCNTSGAIKAPIGAVSAGDFGTLRETIAASLSTVDEKESMLQRHKLVLMSLADGTPESGAVAADDVYQLLRTQGVNEGAEGGIFLLSEDAVRTWKGDPHEQAMAFAHLAAFDAMRRDWGNARSSASAGLFQIRDFSEAIVKGRAIPTQRGPLPQGAAGDRAAIAVEAAERGDDPAYAFVRSDFELGYLMKAIASDQIGETGERDEALAAAVSLAPRLGPLAERVRTGDYNTVFFVDFGLGPEKVRAPYDPVIALYRPITRSDLGTLAVTVDGRSEGDVAIATDVNRLAQDVRWAGYEDLRRAKDNFGNALIAGGAITAASLDNDTGAAVGLGLIAAGLIQKATSGADTRYNELIPQRTYIAVANLTPGALHRVELAIVNRPESQLILPVVPGPTDHSARLHYVRLPGGGPGVPNGPWAVSGEINYANDVTGPIAPAPSLDNLPWIIGGRCVRTPNADVLAEYHANGLPRRYQLEDLYSWYELEGIQIAGRLVDAPVGRHVLEGGTWLYTPAPGSAGFARLFGAVRAPYRPKSPPVAAVRAELVGPPVSSPGTLLSLTTAQVEASR
ncbi:MAG: hypothetical protein AAGI30_08425 [Planctomycetota bacterium]